MGKQRENGALSICTPPTSRFFKCPGKPPQHCCLFPPFRKISKLSTGGYRKHVVSPSPSAVDQPLWGSYQTALCNRTRMDVSVRHPSWLSSDSLGEISLLNQNGPSEPSERTRERPSHYSHAHNALTIFASQ